jgi:putative inorganic carbon (HCO3(-)) transporter
MSALILFVAGRKGNAIRRKSVNFVFLAFFVLQLILLPFSLLPIRSIPAIVWWLGYLAIFLFYQNLVKSERVLENLSKMLVVLTTVFGVVSIYNFIETGLTSYTRLDGFIGIHNIYGGFLILPLMQSIYLVFNEKRLRSKICWSASLVVILASLILTFSRGTWLSIIAALVFAVILFRQKIFQNQSPKAIAVRNWQMIVILLFLTLVSIGVIWQIAKISTQNNSRDSISNVKIFSGESAEENAFVARLHYFADAWNVFAKSPAVGFGLGTYPNALRMYKIDPNFGLAVDPHNWLLRMAVEDGFVVTVVFVIFIIFLFVGIYRLILKRKDKSWLSISIFTGLIGGTIHGLMDFDWSVNLLLLVFFIFSGSLYGHLINTEGFDSENHNAKLKRFLPSYISYSLLVLVCIGSIISIQMFRADLARERGDEFYFMKHDIGKAIDNYLESAVINPYEPTIWYDLWQAYYISKKYDAAVKCLNKAISIFPKNGFYYMALAQTEQAMGNTINYRANLLRSIEYFPDSELEAQVRLAEFEYGQGKYSEAGSIINDSLPVYSKYQSTVWFKSDPNSGVVNQNIEKLKLLKVLIGKKSGLNL